MILLAVDHRKLAHATFTDLLSDLVVGDRGIDHGGESNGLARCCQP